jgi:hypothetical protein
MMSIDYRNHLALLAEVFQSGRETMIGEAKYVVDERDPPVPEGGPQREYAASDVVAPRCP